MIVLWWALYGLVMLVIGAFLHWLWMNTGGRHMLHIDVGLSPLDRHGHRTVEGEVASYAGLILGMHD